MNKKKEILTIPRSDRRILSNIPDPENVRNLVNRRGASYQKEEIDPTDVNEIYRLQLLSLRYETNFEVQIKRVKQKVSNKHYAEDISVTGILIFSNSPNNFQIDEIITMKFTIPGGAMPEGYESKVKVKAKVVRQFTKEVDGETRCYYACEFLQPLNDYMTKKRWGLSIFVASLFLLIVSLIVILMRAESVIYFRFNKFLYLYSIIAATFLLSRYLFGIFYRNVPINPKFEPGVSIIIPVFNEEEWIHRTILSCINQYYPVDKLEVIVVDDYSTDRTEEKAKEMIELIHSEGERFKTKNRLSFHKLPQNGGKREALVAGVHLAKHDLVVFVDSDSFLEPHAIRNIVQPFQDPKMAGVAGRTEVENKFTNALTKLQTVRYYIAFRIMKAAESWFDTVTCLSGPLACYRKELILKNETAWLNQKFLGQPATFGDDRSMTNYILKTHRTGYQDNAVCSTIVPSDSKVFLSQQMRWKRSWLRESLRAFLFMWKKEPFMFLFFIIGLIVPIAAPIVVVYNLLYVPIMHGVFPTTFLMGLLLMAMLMSLAHLFFRKSKLWTFGFIFVLFYEFILLWQMPVAWVTFWKSTWGTRETPQDVIAKEKKLEKQKLRKSRFSILNRKMGEKK
ncbi:hyaluronan synthase [Lysinibacillus sphaericus]|uniref:glycosyltransferase family 2 protein n=1 Tax=Lysinibacillus sphaericus TaxID=1421 RepID=UPI0018CDD0EE|nr:glycosyltransferase [Lysinibacillus sphaericus]MBG9456092.1 hyaluronan synthase [Lysinibacillus sphaericus]MBG9477531.1 hyaluronan synthase [Lysinibacillus sphaericus]MBG9593520.1 hyaluronan synthase [Lysinibacillus sphaericus]